MSNEPKVIICTLRMAEGASDCRLDPFWKQGSFGLTGCHARNLMHYGKHDKLHGARLAFAQAGPDESKPNSREPKERKLVYMTPPITTKIHKRNGVKLVEACWEPSRPLAYKSAPVLASNIRPSDFPTFYEEHVKHTKRNTPIAKFSSRFRSRRKPLNPPSARELIKVYDCHRNNGDVIESCYTEALSESCQNSMRICRNRREAYEGCRRNVGFCCCQSLGNSSNRRSSC